MKAPDQNDLHRNGALPETPFAGLHKARSPAPGRNLVMVNAATIALPLPSLAPLVASLGIVAGFPTCFGGYGYSRKTLAAQSFALAVASGLPLWGMHHVPRGRALHIDYEQGTRLTHERYQRLAHGMGIDLTALGDSLHVCTLPDVYVTDKDASDVFARAVDGFDVVVVDSLRAATKGADENSSNIREPIDVLGRISERTGAVVLVIHHARKPKEHSTGAKYSLRGSSALFDSFSSVFVFSADKDQPTTVSHEKSRADGRTVDDFRLDTQDIDIHGDPCGGLLVTQVGGGAAPPTPFDAVKARVLELLRTTPDLSTKNAVCARVTGTRTHVLQAVDELVNQGVIGLQPGVGYALL